MIEMILLVNPVNRDNELKKTPRQKWKNVKNENIEFLIDKW